MEIINITSDGSNWDWFDGLYKDRTEWMTSTRKNKFEQGIHRSAVDKYAEPTHFVYELLQNAEDQGASRAYFKLEETRLIFGHNGAEFSKEDVVSITGLGNSSKSEHANKIGRFGIGFKSVFAITERPEIHTTIQDIPFSFAIEDLVVPIRIQHHELLKSFKTLFIMPFLVREQPSLYKAILSKLQSLGADTMLFIDCLEDISWETDQAQGTYICQRKNRVGARTIHIQLIEESGEKNTEKRTIEQNYIQYFKRVAIDASDRELTVRIAFKMANGEIVPEPEGAVLNVYFPTEEKTGLKFRVHAPMLLTDNRANVKRNNLENIALIKECANLLAESLPRLQSQGLMTVTALGCLPIERERFIGNQWQPLFDAARKELQIQPLLPSDTGVHVSSTDARLASTDGLRKLVNPEQLGTLTGSEKPCSWLSSEITERKLPLLWEYLTRDVEIKEETPQTFGVKLNRHFLEQQSDEWLIDLYSLLLDVPGLWRGDFRSVEPVLRSNPERPIIRLTNDEMIAPFARASETPLAYLPGEDETSFPTVKSSLCNSARSLTFFQQMGLRQPSVVDDIKHGSLKRLESYKNNIDLERCERDFRQIALAITRANNEALRSELSTALSRCPVLVQRPRKPEEQSIMPIWDAFSPTEDVLNWFDGSNKAWVISDKMVAMNCWPTIRDFLSSRRTSHPETKQTIFPFPELRILRRTQDSKGIVTIKDHHSNHERGLGGFDPDADIEGLDYAIRHPNLERAVIIWDLLLADSASINGQVESATQRTFENAELTTRYSRIGQALVDSAWLPNNDGAFNIPRNLAIGDLPEEFDCVSHNAQILAEKLCMRNSQLADAAKQIGVPVDIVALIKQGYADDPEGFRTRLEREKTRHFPVHESPNPERRYAKVFDIAQDAQEKQYEIKLRSVRTSANFAAGHKREYLQEFYTDDAGDLICQICKLRMPFRLDDGNPYFEAVDLLPSLKYELVETCLALCPTCSAKYHYANGSSNADIANRLQTTQSLEIEILLAQSRHMVRFVSTHLRDIRSVLAAHELKSGITFD